MCCKCLLLRCVCDIFNAVLHFARDVRHFICAILGFVCKVLEKNRQNFENVCKQLKKTVKYSELSKLDQNAQYLHSHCILSCSLLY